MARRHRIAPGGFVYHVMNRAAGRLVLFEPSSDYTAFERLMSRAQRQALDHGVRVSGATVHLVTSELDGGPIVLQAAVPVHADDTVETLSARVLAEEHRLYPDAIRLVLEGGWTIVGRRLVRGSAS